MKLFASHFHQSDRCGRIRLVLPAVLMLFGALVTAAAEGLAGSRPNIVFILTDDQGYGDLSCHGNPILRTPNLDRLHAEGARFTDFHVSPTCAPTRSALLTGRHEFRNGVTHTIFERERLTLDAVTLPQVLKRAGYRTGIFGKWHLGDEPERWPDKRGFDEMLIHGAGGIGQSYPGSCGDAPGNTYFSPYLLHNGKFEKSDGYCTDVFFDGAIRWMEKAKEGGPFYCHLATNAPHAPLQVKPEDEARYAGRVPEQTAKFFGMIANIDDNVGRLLAKLKEWRIEDRTLVVFMNDNGGTAGVSVFNAGMRGQKGSPWLGGTRAASFWRWPGRVSAGDRTPLAAHVDFFPTVAAMAGQPLTEREQRQVEGRSLLPLLEDPAAGWPDRTLVTHVGRWERGASPETGKYAHVSVRNTRWHLVSVPAGPKKAAGTSPGKPDPRPDWQLFDLSADRGEKNDVASAHPEVVDRLSGHFESWWTDIQPQLVNESAVAPAENPFKTLFRQQIGP